MGIQFGMCTDFVKLDYTSKEDCMEAQIGVNKTLSKHSTGYTVCSPKQN